MKDAVCLHKRWENGKLINSWNFINTITGESVPETHVFNLQILMVSDRRVEKYMCPFNTFFMCVCVCQQLWEPFSILPLSFHSCQSFSVTPHFLLFHHLLSTKVDLNDTTIVSVPSEETPLSLHLTFISLAQRLWKKRFLLLSRTFFSTAQGAQNQSKYTGKFTVPRGIGRHQKRGLFQLICETHGWENLHWNMLIFFLFT